LGNNFIKILFITLFLFSGCVQKQNHFANSVIEFMKKEKVVGWIGENESKPIIYKNYDIIDVTGSVKNKPKIKHKKLHKNKTLISLKIPFDFDDYKVKKEYYEDIEQIADYINCHPEVKEVEILGYTDDMGDSDYNLWLSNKRAKEVANLLIKFGVNPEKLVVKGMGDKNPLVPNTTLENRKINRRVEIIIKG
jgi:OOP family OmpA-OmpF porin